MIFKHVVVLITFYTLGIKCRYVGRDCGKKTFSCVNESHFQMCMDFGNGVLTTIGDFVVKCPDDTECNEGNSFECELRKETKTRVRLSVDSSNTNENVEPLLPPESSFVEAISRNIDAESTKNATFEAALGDGSTKGNISDSPLNVDATTINDTTAKSENTEQYESVISYNVTTENIIVEYSETTILVETNLTLSEAIENVTAKAVNITSDIPYREYIHSSSYIDEPNTTEPSPTVSLEFDRLHKDLLNQKTNLSYNKTSVEANNGITTIFTIASTISEGSMIDNRTVNEILNQNLSPQKLSVDKINKNNITETIVGTNVSSFGIISNEYNRSLLTDSPSHNVSTESYLIDVGSTEATFNEEITTNITSKLSMSGSNENVTTKLPLTNILDHVAPSIQNKIPHGNLSELYKKNETVENIPSSVFIEDVLTESNITENFTLSSLVIENNSLTVASYIETTTTSFPIFENHKTNHDGKLGSFITLKTEENQTKRNDTYSDVAENLNSTSNINETSDSSLELTLLASINLNLKMTKNTHNILNASAEAIFKELIEEIKILEVQYFGNNTIETANKTSLEKSFDINEFLYYSELSEINASTNTENSPGLINISISVFKSSDEMSSQVDSTSNMTNKKSVETIYSPFEPKILNEMDDLLFATETVNLTKYKTTHSSDSTFVVGIEAVDSNISTAASTFSSVKNDTIGKNTYYATTPIYTKDFEATASQQLLPYTLDITKTKPECFNCKNKEPGIYRDPNSVNHFLICVGKSRPMRIECYKETFFDYRQKKCVDLVTEFKCEKEGKFVDESNDQYYYICLKTEDSFRKFKLKCKSGLRVNRETLKCDNE